MPDLDDASDEVHLKPVMSSSAIIAEPESMSPGDGSLLASSDGGYPTHTASSPKQHRTNTSKRLSGRLPNKSISSSYSISSLSSLGSIFTPDRPDAEAKSGEAKYHHHVRNPDRASHIISQVAEWLQSEKAKKATHKSRRKAARAKLTHAANVPGTLTDHFRNDGSKQHKHHHARTDSDVSEGSAALEELERILSHNLDLGDNGIATPKEDTKHSRIPHRKSIRKGSKRLLRRGSTIGGSSDTDYQDNEILVPAAEVILDNSKTLGYAGGAASSETNLLNSGKRIAKEKEAWRIFKMEIVRLTHTLNISGWRRVPIDQGGEIDVERLSGALTNAVYVVSPPKNPAQTPTIAQDSTASLVPKKRPPKLLLRIYGPQVEHLIDRESELQILRRLARKKIGPRLLGIFTNGRFEQFFHARTLTATDLRNPETSKQIAKRMRELHDGIDLLKEERDEGAFVWRNWDKWVDRCDEVISWLDQQILADRQGPRKARPEEWKKRGLVCGVEWSVFRRAVDNYRRWLFEQYRGAQNIRRKLVFAHNDTQYGNLLRLEPSGESPLLLPANEHKQLIVIDFEYASANVPGLEFANHFTEWCYNYHDSTKSYALNAKNYPTPEEQHRFVKAYVQHRPPILSRPTLSPITAPSTGPSSSISSFMLDSRAPPGGYAEEESRRDQAVEREIERLRLETRMWRVANSAQWVAWGILQAKVPGMDEALEAQKGGTLTPKSRDPMAAISQEHIDSDPLRPEMVALAQDACDKRPESRENVDERAGDEEEGEAFDYLAYAQDRAMFFWGDILQLGIMKKEDLPEELLQKVKVVEY